MIGLMALLHHQYPPRVWYHRMPPFDFSSCSSPHPYGVEADGLAATTGRKLPAPARKYASR